MDRPKTTIASVAKAVRVLFAVARTPNGAGAGEVAEAVGLPTPTAYHLLNTLTAEAVLTKGSDRRYRLGPRVGALSAAYFEQSEPDESLLAPLRALAEQTGETAYLSGWRGADIEVLATAEGGHAVRAAGLTRGTHGHGHARASGKVLLAHASAGLREGYLARNELTAMTPKTITDPDLLSRELERVRREGIAVDDEEFALGVGCLAAPVMFEDEVIGVYTVSAPIERFRDTEASLRAALRAATASASP